MLAGLIKSTCESGYDTEAELHTVVCGHGFLERTTPRFHGLGGIIGQPEFTEQFDAIITHMKRCPEDPFDVFSTAFKPIKSRQGFEDGPSVFGMMEIFEA